MNLGGSFALKVSMSGVDVVFFVFIQVAFCTCKRLYSAIVVSIRDVIVVDVDQAFALVDFAPSEYFNFDPFLELWRT